MVAIRRRTTHGGVSRRRGDGHIARSCPVVPGLGTGGLTGPTIPRDLRERLHPWIRAELIVRMIVRTHWDSAAWPMMRAELKRVIRMQSALRRGCWWD